MSRLDHEVPSSPTQTNFSEPSMLWPLPEATAFCDQSSGLGTLLTRDPHYCCGQQLAALEAENTPSLGSTLCCASQF